ncbi:hypothetical protein V8G54_029161 [Vigna mungo]|uniref:Uncharacterized protein n=1 Tax=Vigna mungo TaxID=3915 RepID=A0AAQ3MTR1_VIGMU
MIKMPSKLPRRACSFPSHRQTRGLNRKKHGTSCVLLPCHHLHSMTFHKHHFSHPPPPWQSHRHGHHHNTHSLPRRTQHHHKHRILRSCKIKHHHYHHHHMLWSFHKQRWDHLQSHRRLQKKSKKRNPEAPSSPWRPSNKRRLLSLLYRSDIDEMRS